MPRILYQAATAYQFIKAGIKELYKVTTIERIVVVLVTNRRFVQMRSLLQEVVQLGIGVELPYRSVGSTVGRYFGIWQNFLYLLADFSRVVT